MPQNPSLFVEHSGTGEMNTLSLLECLTLITAFQRFFFCLWSLYFFGAFSVIHPNQVHTWARLSLGLVFFPHLNYRNKTTCKVFMGKACSSDPFIILSYLALRPRYKEIQIFQWLAGAVLVCMSHFSLFQLPSFFSPLHQKTVVVSFNSDNSLIKDCHLKDFSLQTLQMKGEGTRDNNNSHFNYFSFFWSCFLIPLWKQR